MATPVTPVVAAKVSWLKKLGQDVLKALGIAGQAEKAAEPIVEALVPASAPIFGILDIIFPIVATTEQAFAAVGQALNGPAKLQAALGGVESAIDQWTVANLPGSAAILATDAYIQARLVAATAYVNATVAFANALPVNPATAVTSAGVAAGAAAKAAVAAKS